MSVMRQKNVDRGCVERKSRMPLGNEWRPDSLQKGLCLRSWLTTFLVDKECGCCEEEFHEPFKEVMLPRDQLLTCQR